MSPQRSSVVCATDFSDRANDAGGIAAKLAAGRSERLLLVHVAESSNPSDLANAKARLEREVKRLRKTEAVVEMAVVQGVLPADSLLEFLHHELPSVVVVASRTKGPLDRWALGSVSEKIAQSAPVPTLVIHDPAPFRDWGWTGSRLKILAALDLHTDSDAVLRFIRELGRAGPLDVVPCHVNWKAHRVGETTFTVAEPKNPPALQQQLERALKKQVRDHLGDDVADVIVEPTCGEVAPRLVDIAEDVEADLIVVGTHQRHGISRLFHGSVSRGLLHQAGTNIVCVPTAAKFDPREAHIPDFRRVLVATDFSPLGNAAVPFACAACCIGGLVKIVHVAEQARGRATSSKLSDLRQRLRDLIPVETGARCQPPQVEVLQDGEPAAAICEEADRFGADLVCLSSHGLGASRALHGSITKAVLKEIRRPVLVIRRPDE